MPSYKNVAIPLSLHRRVAILTARLGRTIGGKGGVAAELLEKWLDENRQEERQDAPTIERDPRVTDPD
jgi:hypothetical protein